MVSFSGLPLRRAAGVLAAATLSACITTPNLLPAGSRFSLDPRTGSAVRASTAAEDAGPIQILHPYLASRVRVLESRSPRLRAEMETLRAGDVRVYIGTPEQVAEVEERVVVLGREMPSRRLGEFAAMLDPVTGELSVLVVRINLPEIIRFHRRHLRPNGFIGGNRLTLNEFMDAILIHEIWGHLIPVARARSLAAHCPDPRPGQPDLESCVMRRENELRREIGLRPRTQYRWSRSGRL